MGADTDADAEKVEIEDAWRLASSSADSLRGFTSLASNERKRNANQTDAQPHPISAPTIGCRQAAAALMPQATTRRTCHIARRPLQSVPIMIIGQWQEPFST